MYPIIPSDPLWKIVQGSFLKPEDLSDHVAGMLRLAGAVNV
jgi:hypothetical protein